jgi:hypothetical protein
VRRLATKSWRIYSTDERHYRPQCTPLASPYLQHVFRVSNPRLEPPSRECPRVTSNLPKRP